MAQVNWSSPAVEASYTLTLCFMIIWDDGIKPHQLYADYMGQKLSSSILGKDEMVGSTLTRYMMGIWDDNSRPLF